MRKTRKRFIAAAIVCVMAFSMSACGQTDEKASKQQSSSASGENNVASTDAGAGGTEEIVNELDWLNLGGVVPIVEEGTEKTLRIYVSMDEASPDPEELWLYKFIENGLNINLEVTKFTATNRDEFISLAFASGDLPDIIIGANFSTGELVKYGSLEGQLLDLAPYINENYMPQVSAIYDENPIYKNVITNTEGEVYSVGAIGNTYDSESLPRMFVNLALLEELGIENPTTLDEFLEAARAVKAAYPDMYPIGGSYTQYSPYLYILNAFGYLTIGTEMGICLRNGEVVLPCADRGAYGEFLKFMNILYEEGLIHPDFFTMDKDTEKATMVSGKNVWYRQAPFLFVEDYLDWWSPNPLTSEWNDTAQWPAAVGAVKAGGAVVTSNCEEVELAVAFLDWFYTYENYRISTAGMLDTYENFEEYTYDGYRGRTYNVEEKKAYFNDMVAEPDKYTNSSDYLIAKVRMWPFFILGDYRYSSYEECGEYNSYEVRKEQMFATNSDPVETRYNSPSGQTSFQFAMEYGIGQYLTEDLYPSYTYLSAEDVERASTLSVPITEYAEQESAKFITGARSLDELDDYFDELERLGALEYVQIYADYYAAMQAE